MKKVKLFTHTDLDGVGCAILSQFCFSNIDITYCNYNDVNNLVLDFINDKKYELYDKIYITDVSVNEDIASKIESISRLKFVLLDHHETALNLNKFDFCKVVIQNDNGKVCGTSLFYEELLKLNDEICVAESFVELVRQYDTWEWTTKYNNIKPKKLNDLYYLYGRDMFIKNISDKLEFDDHFTFSRQDKLLIDIDSEKRKAYINKKEATMNIYKILDFNAGVVFAEQYISELGNYLVDKYQNKIDVAIIINDNVISYRSKKANIDAGAIAKQFGGGGHTNSAGSQIDSFKKNMYIKELFNIK